MALATGIEAPSSAIAQLGELDDPDRRRFGRITLWVTLLVVGTLTLGLTAELVHLRIGVPPNDSTQIAELARVATAPPLFAAFQLATALLLLSAASSSFQAGPGLLKALARQRQREDPERASLVETRHRRLAREFEHAVERPVARRSNPADVVRQIEIRVDEPARR